MKDRNFLHQMYNATSTDDGNGELETYEYWLERQLLSRIEDLDKTEERKLLEQRLELEKSKVVAIDDMIAFNHRNIMALKGERAGRIGTINKIETKLKAQE